MNCRIEELLEYQNSMSNTEAISHHDVYIDSYYHDKYHDVYDDRYIDSYYSDSSRYDDSY